METQPIPPAPAWATVFAYEDMAVSTLDGRTLVVRVRQVRARQAFYALGIIEDEFALLEYVCIAAPNGDLPQGELPPGWVDLLTPDSHGELVEKARSLNLSVILAALKRTSGMLDTLGPLGPSLIKAKALKSSLTNAS